MNIAYFYKVNVFTLKSFKIIEGRFLPQKASANGVRITKIQDDGERFIIHGESGLLQELKEVFDNMALGISVTPSDKGVANILYTENNRDIVLRILNERTK